MSPRVPGRPGAGEQAADPGRLGGPRPGSGSCAWPPPAAERGFGVSSAGAVHCVLSGASGRLLRHLPRVSFT